MAFVEWAKQKPTEDTVVMLYCAKFADKEIWNSICGIWQNVCNKNGNND